MKRLKKIVGVLLGAVILVALGALLTFRYARPVIVTYQAPQLTEDELRQRGIKQELEDPKMQQDIIIEATRRYDLKQLKTLQDDLLKLNSGGFTNEAERQTSLKTFLHRVNPSLVPYVQQLVALPRYIETIAIAGQETSFCTTGTATLNNCGGVKDRDGHFKSYSSKLESLKDMSRIIATVYGSKTIDQMNGSYCVDEVRGHGQCPSWTENIRTHITNLLITN